jgi:hypothetical protein
MTSGEGFVLRDGAPRLTTWSCPGRERCLTPESFLVLRIFLVSNTYDRLTLRGARSSRPTYVLELLL